MIDPNLPLVDIHRHLDGNIRPLTIWELAAQHNLALPANSLDELLPLCQIQDKTADLLAFLAKLDYGVSVLANPDACYRIAYENMQDASLSGLDYVELRFSPYYMAQHHGLNVADVVAAVVQGCADGERDFALKYNLIGILSRTFGTDACTQELAGLLAHKAHITALDLAGDELGYPAPIFVEHFKQARDAGWQITVHAGEADGPQSIWNAIELLGASRIGHGVAAQHDERLMQYLADQRIGIEACPTSNYQTATVIDTANHPLKRFLQAGIEVTLNTDDPGVSAIDISHEYRVAHEVIGLTVEQLRQVQMNGVHQAFISAAEKQRLLDGARAR
ncbi:adenosine deaminase [Alteromonas lipolytica]|uniref:Adenosine deaminase n=1 Tax=Alteromonas lipolytica TaxID=1856405 RepID=A0A1E8FIK2_9ALTE|nr:adenosine deaminase [Alteromonas lipolytica]OFI35293.1 adenosine deaminase [Alteromonas lipolytica]GGF58347.1 adenosine deaminase [Alteromonas lipolytica]